MNKKFSTLVAGALLATSVGTVSAQIASTEALQKYEDGKYYVIAGGNTATGAAAGTDSTLSVTKSASGYILSMSSSRTKTLAEIDSALWKVSITTTPGASTPTYQFTNKATGLPLSIDLGQVASFDIAPAADSLKVGGAINQWKNAPSLSVASASVQPYAMLSSSLDGDSAAVLAISDAGNIKAFKIGNNQVNGAVVTSATDYTTLQVRFYEAESVYLNAADLNTMMWTKNTADFKNGWFKLNYTPGLIGSVNTPNIFDKELQAIPAKVAASTTDADYTNPVTAGDSIYLKIKDEKVKDHQAFAMLDTAYYNLNQATDTVANKFRQFVYGDTIGTAIQTANGSLPQFAFKFKYFPTQDSIAIYTSSAAKRQIYGDGSTYWKDANASISLTDTLVNIVALVKNKHTEFAVGPESNGSNSAGVRFSFNAAVNGKLAVIPSGYYYIQNLNPDSPVLTDKKKNYYFTIGLDSVLTYLPDGNKDWMTASHWIVKTDGNYSSVSNREFQNAQIKDNGIANVPVGLFYETADFSKDNMVVTDLAGNTVKFVPVADLTQTGYFNEVYTSLEQKAYALQYFTGFEGITAFVNAKSDSVLNVQEAEKASKFFELVRMPQSTGNDINKLEVYTYQKDAANKDVNPLTRAAYQIRVKVPVGTNVADAEREYVILDGNKYKVSKRSAGTKAAVFFLKKTTKAANYVLVDTTVVNSNTPKNSASKIVVSDATSSVNDLEYVTLNGRTSSFMLTEETQPIYRRLGKTMDEDEFTDLDVDTANFYISSNPARFLYENTMDKIAGTGNAKNGLHYLGEYNSAQYPSKKPAMFIDTAYVRNETKRPQYMIALRPEVTHSKPCPDDPTHPVTGEDALLADYLVNLEDSTETVDQALYETYTRLAFVPAKHKEDKLIIKNSKHTGTTDATKDTIDLSKNEFNRVTFQFRLVKEGSNDFYIESRQGQYIKILNGVPVLTPRMVDAEKFNLTKVTDKPVANETIEANAINVVAGEGNVTVYGAAGKKVIVSNVLGQKTTIVATSDSEVIAAPQGVVIVAVEGEAAVKAVVK